MKITGVLVDILVKLAPEVYAEYVVYKNGKKVLLLCFGDCATSLFGTEASFSSKHVQKLPKAT